MLLATLFVGAGAAAAETATGRLTVVELFTSQGCSSCPPTDKMVGELARQPGILALTYNVDYWDYLGWKDTLATPENTQRQRWYAERFHLRYVYTPQIVVQGLAPDAGGSGIVYAQIQRAEALPVVTPRIVKAGTGLRLELPAAKVAGKVRLLMAAYDHEHAADIANGENGGRRITYHNVVRRLVPLGTWDGAAATRDLPWEKGWGEDCAVLLQAADTGRIIGAARAPW